MTTRAVAEMDDWDAAPFSGGYAGLRDLADEEFSGVVQAGAAKCCLLNGTVVGVLDGSIEDFEDAEGTAYEAPSPALPLLALMQERGDEVKAKYYTEDTPLSEVDRTLSDGGFSGFIELSENVLSGDYYVVYHAGRSMSVAWVGNMGELLTGDEAFERADDEVGIYEVRQVDVEAVEIPEPSGDAGTDAAAAGAGAATASAAGSDDGTTASGGADDGTTASGGADDENATGSADAVGTATEADRSEASSRSDDGGTGAASSTVETVEETSAADDDGSAGTDADDATSSEQATVDDAEDPDATAVAERDRPTEAGEDSAATERSTAAAGDDDAAGQASEAAADDEAPPETDRSTAGGSRAEESADTADRGPATGEASADDAGRSSGGASDASQPAGGADDADRSPAGSDGTDRSDVAESTASTAETDARPERTGESETGGNARSGRDRSNAGTTGSGGVESGGTRRRESPSRSSADASGSEGRDAGSGAASPTERLATRSIPSLDPARTSADESAEGGGAAAGADRTRPGASGTGTDRESESTSATPSGSTGSPDAAREASGSGRDGAEPRPESATRTGGQETSPERTSGSPESGGTAGSRGTDQSGQGASNERVAELETELEEREAEIDRLESELAAAEEEREDLRRELETVREERDALESERDALQSERDELATELEEREAELDRVRTELNELEAEFGGAADADQRLTPSEALDGTNLFVRYESKGKATLESAHGGSASREEVYENLNLELHTQFDAATATVGSQAYDEFLRGTLQYRFVAWVVQELLWEIRDTGKVAALEDLYNAIPQIDRAELNGVVTVEFTEDGQQRRSEEAFDIVLRDRMGNPLVVTNLNDSRDAASEGMMNSLVTAASRVSESNGSLSAALFVTSSFFEPEALETAADATSGSLLSRDKRESFVKLSRKRGYHLCLAEARDEQFHLAVPEL